MLLPFVFALCGQQICQNLDRVNNLETRCSQMHRATRVSADNDRGTGSLRRPVDYINLAVPCGGGQFGLEKRIGATRSTAETVVIKIDHITAMAENLSN